VHRRVRHTHCPSPRGVRCASSIAHSQAWCHGPAGRTPAARGTGPVTGARRERRRRAAARALDYITSRGWPCFVAVRHRSWPVLNCERSERAHDAAADGVVRMLVLSRVLRGDAGCIACGGDARLHPRGLLAVRTGAASGTVVIDVDAGGVPAMRRHDRRRLAAADAGAAHRQRLSPGCTRIRVFGSCPGPARAGPYDIKSDDPYIVVAPSLHRAPAGRTGGSGRSPRSCAAATVLGAAPGQPDRRALPARVRLKRCGAPSMRSVLWRRQLAELLEAKEGTRTTPSTRARSPWASSSAPGCSASKRDSVLEDAGQRIGLSPGEARRSVASGLRAGTQHRGAAASDRPAAGTWPRRCRRPSAAGAGARAVPAAPGH